MAKKKPKKGVLTIWTYAYRPFILGGNVNGPISCDVEIGHPIAIGRGLYAYEIQSPNSRRVAIAESTTGAIVGTSVEMVRQDIRDGNPRTMRDQLREAEIVARRDVDNIGWDRFWGLYDPKPKRRTKRE